MAGERTQGGVFAASRWTISNRRGFPAFNLANRLGQGGSFAAGTPRRLRRGNAGWARLRSAVAQLPPLALGATINSSTYTSGTALRARRGRPRTPTLSPAPFNPRLEFRCNFDCVCPDRKPGRAGHRVRVLAWQPALTRYHSGLLGRGFRWGLGCGRGHGRWLRRLPLGLHVNLRLSLRFALGCALHRSVTSRLM